MLTVEEFLYAAVKEEPRTQKERKCIFPFPFPFYNYLYGSLSWLRKCRVRNIFSDDADQFGNGFGIQSAVIDIK